MRFVFALSLLLVGCGRIGFGSALTGDGGGDDAGPPGDGDGDAVDDGPGANDVQVRLSSTGDCPAVAWSGTQIGVTWREGGFSGPAIVQFAAFDSGGSMVQGPLAVMASNNMECPAIEWSGAQFLVAVSHGPANRRDIDVVVVNSAGVGATTNVVSDSGDSTAPKLALALDLSTVLLVWRDLQGGNYHVNVRPLTTLGVPTLPAAQASGLVNTNGPPHVTAKPGGFAVAWAGGLATRLRIYNTSGVATATEVGTASMADDGVPIVWNGAELIVAWSELTGNSIFTARFFASGALSAGPFAFGQDAPDHMALAPTTTGAALLFAESSGLVQFHLAYLGSTGEYVNQEPLNNAATDSWSSLVTAGPRLVAGMDNASGAYVRVIEP